ncbi:hypothetical protein BT63DRAFT_479567 [Microthyrium microscopicum]|uniref:Uncharacterized protein n=1 Tax=Microthyrium microscopicum TaxID=703497 RepID=A0A6A6U958_9PEZI|nr:hypothetical protein BT63DRAFT_479567 [Microthyrium microscopicum]
MASASGSSMIPTRPSASTPAAITHPKIRTFEEEQQLDEATRILEGQTNLIHHATDMNQSLPQTKAYFTRLAHSITQAPEPDWPMINNRTTTGSPLAGTIATPLRRYTGKTASSPAPPTSAPLSPRKHVLVEEASTGRRRAPPLDDVEMGESGGKDTGKARKKRRSGALESGRRH